MRSRFFRLDICIEVFLFRSFAFSFVWVFLGGLFFSRFLFLFVWGLFLFFLCFFFVFFFCLFVCCFLFCFVLLCFVFCFLLHNVISLNLHANSTFLWAKFSSANLYFSRQDKNFSTPHSSFCLCMKHTFAHVHVKIWSNRIHQVNISDKRPRRLIFFVSFFLVLFCFSLVSFFFFFFLFIFFVNGIKSVRNMKEP